FQARLAAYGVTTTAGAQTLPPATGLRDTMNRLFQPAADRMGRGDVKKGKPSVAEQLQRADLKLRPSEYFMIQLGSGALVGLIGFWRWGPLFALLFFAGYLIPGFYVKYRIGQRLKKFNAQLGDTLTLLSNALKAGYSFAQAIDTVAKNAVPPIGDEFGRAVREMNLGGSPDEALMNITKRVISPDFDLVATAYAIHRTVGGNLAEILDNIAYTIRERVRRPRHHRAPAPPGLRRREAADHGGGRAAEAVQRARPAADDREARCAPFSLDAARGAQEAAQRARPCRSARQPHARGLRG